MSDLTKIGSGSINVLNGTVVGTTIDCSIISFNVTGTWSATIVIEGTINAGTTWIPIDGDIDATDTIINNFSVNSLITVNCASYGEVRLRASVYTSGTLNCIWESGPGLSLVEVFNTNVASLKATVNIQDGSSNAITSTTINSKQRLDVNLSSEAVDGSTSPFNTVQVGGKDTGGNLQTISTDTTGAIFVSTRLALTGSAPSAASVGVSSGVVIAANSSRRGLVLTNTSNNVVSFNIAGGSAVLREGITLYPGGNWDMDEFTFTTSAINGIASAASSNIAIQELT